VARPGPVAIDVWQGVAMTSLRFQPGLPGPTLLLRHTGGPPLKRPSTLLDTPRHAPMSVTCESRSDGIFKNDKKDIIYHFGSKIINSNTEGSEIQEEDSPRDKTAG
jgi:hypothetical protein